jgi:hypothetical protein
VLEGYLGRMRDAVEAARGRVGAGMKAG